MQMTFSTLTAISQHLRFCSFVPDCSSPEEHNPYVSRFRSTRSASHLIRSTFYSRYPRCWITAPGVPEVDSSCTTSRRAFVEVLRSSERASIVSSTCHFRSFQRYRVQELLDPDGCSLLSS